MIKRDSVRTRLEERDQGISYTEFSYMLMQAYDFLHLFREHDCTIQMGGSDQWGNILSGKELIRRVAGGRSEGITFPLLTTSTGKKFGKTEEGSVWLDAKRTSPYQMYQYWLQTADADVVRYLKLFTFLLQDRIRELDQGVASQPEKREAQRELAVPLHRDHPWRMRLRRRRPPPAGYCSDRTKLRAEKPSRCCCASCRHAPRRSSPAFRWSIFLCERVWRKAKARRGS